jgi:hypothetical protein
MIYFISFGTLDNYKESTERIKKEAVEMGIFDKIIVYTQFDFDEEYKNRHQNFFNANRRGYGYWMWKSYIVLKTLNKMQDDDILIYADAGCTLNNNLMAKNRLSVYINLCKSSKFGNLAFQMHYIEKEWTKMDMFITLDANKPEIMNSGQLVGTVFILKKCLHVMNLVNEWYTISHNYQLISDFPSVIPNDPSFRDHRHDQSIFSILRKKRGAQIIKDEVDFDDYNDLKCKSYPIVATRLRK